MLLMFYFASVVLSQIFMDIYSKKNEKLREKPAKLHTFGKQLKYY